MNFTARTYLWHIALLRLYVGYYLFSQGVQKYQRGFASSDWIGRQIGDLAKVDLLPWYRTFLAEYVAPNRELFGYLVTAGEIVVGAGLFLGLLTRLNAALAMFMLVNFYLGPGMARGGLILDQQHIFMVALLIIFLSNAGKSLGLDALLFRRKIKASR